MHCLRATRSRDRAAGVGEVWSTDCIVHASNAVQVPMLAEALRSIVRD